MKRSTFFKTIGLGFLATLFSKETKAKSQGSQVVITADVLYKDAYTNPHGENKKKSLIWSFFKKKQINLGSHPKDITLSRIDKLVRSAFEEMKCTENAPQLEYHAKIHTYSVQFFFAE